MASTALTSISRTSQSRQVQPNTLLHCGTLLEGRSLITRLLKNALTYFLSGWHLQYEQTNRNFIPVSLHSYPHPCRPRDPPGSRSFLSLTNHHWSSKSTIYSRLQPEALEFLMNLTRNLPRHASCWIFCFRKGTRLGPISPMPVLFFTLCVGYHWMMCLFGLSGLYQVGRPGVQWGGWLCRFKARNRHLTCTIKLVAMDHIMCLSTMKNHRIHAIELWSSSKLI